MFHYYFNSSSMTQEIKLIFDETNRISYQGTLNFNIRNFKLSNLIHEDKAMTSILADCSTAFTCKNQSKNEAYSSGNTFFIASSEKPRCGLEKLALCIFNEHTMNSEFDRKRSGAEWWTQVIDSDDDIGFHWDRDYGIESMTGQYIYPHIATVTYLSTCDCPTIIVDLPGSDTSSEPIESSINKIWVSRPILGKHISFDGKLFHGASDSILNSTEKANKSSVRVTFLVNIWLNHIPIESEKFPRKLLKQLQLPLSDDSLFTLHESNEFMTTANYSSQQSKSIKLKFKSNEGSYIFEIPMSDKSEDKDSLIHSDILQIDFNEDVCAKVYKKEKAPLKRKNSSTDSTVKRVSNRRKLV